MTVTTEKPPAAIEAAATVSYDPGLVFDLADAMYWDSMSPVDGYYGRDPGNTAAIGSILIDRYTAPEPDTGCFASDEEAAAAWDIALARRSGRMPSRNVRNFIAAGAMGRGGVS